MSYIIHVDYFYILFDINIEAENMKIYIYVYIYIYIMGFIAALTGHMMLVSSNPPKFPNPLFHLRTTMALSSFKLYIQH